VIVSFGVQQLLNLIQSYLSHFDPFLCFMGPIQNFTSYTSFWKCFSCVYVFDPFWVYFWIEWEIGVKFQTSACEYTVFTCGQFFKTMGTIFIIKTWAILSNNRIALMIQFLGSFKYFRGKSTCLEEKAELKCTLCMCTIYFFHCFIFNPSGESSNSREKKGQIQSTWEPTIQWLANF
jgi:hypothetical protein